MLKVAIMFILTAGVFAFTAVYVVYRLYKEIDE